jgi:hypothetical protein
MAAHSRAHGRAQASHEAVDDAQMRLSGSRNESHVDSGHALPSCAEQEVMGKSI